MQGSWIKKTLSLILTLTLVIGVCGMLPAGALANGGEYQLSPKSTGVDAGGQKTFAVEQTDAAVTPANVPVKYVWSASGGTLVSGGGETDATATYQFDTAGSASVSCALYASAEPDAAAFETPSASVTVNAPAPKTEPKSEPEPAPEPAPTTETTTPSGTTPSESGSGSSGSTQPSLGLSPTGDALAFNPDAITATDPRSIHGQYLAIDNRSGNITWKVEPSTGIITLNGKSNAGATLNVAGVGTATITVTDSVSHETAAITITVKPELVLDRATVDSMAVDESVTLKATTYPGGLHVTFTTDKPDNVTVGGLGTTSVKSGTAGYSGVASTALKARAIGSDINITASVSDGAGGTVEKTCVITAVTGKAPTLSWNPKTVSVVAGNTLNLKSYLKTSGQTVTFDNNGSTIGSLNTTTGVLTTTKGELGTITVSASSAATGIYRAAGPTDITVIVGTNSRITASPSTMKLAVGGSDLAAITKTTGADMDWIITSSNPSVADAELNSTTASDADVGVLSVYGYKTGTAVITVRSEGSTSSATIQVTVGTPTSGVKVNFFSSDNKTTTLTRDYAWGTLQVTVANYNPAQPYVTLTRSNIRTYVRDGGSLASHPSTNSWIARLTPNANDPTVGEATLYVAGQYNGNTTYSASYVYASGVNATNATSQTIYVTGFAALPQTGPDYTWAYVLGGLCLAAIATAVTLNVKRKKKQQDN